MRKKEKKKLRGIIISNAASECLIELAADLEVLPARLLTHMTEVDMESIRRHVGGKQIMRKGDGTKYWFYCYDQDYSLFPNRKRGLVLSGHILKVHREWKKNGYSRYHNITLAEIEQLKASAENGEE